MQPAARPPPQPGGHAGEGPLGNLPSTPPTTRSLNQREFLPADQASQSCHLTPRSSRQDEDPATKALAGPPGVAGPGGGGCGWVAYSSLRGGRFLRTGPGIGPHTRTANEGFLCNLRACVVCGPGGGCGAAGGLWTCCRRAVEHLRRQAGWMSCGLAASRAWRGGPQQPSGLGGLPGGWSQGPGPWGRTQASRALYPALRSVQAEAA